MSNIPSLFYLDPVYAGKHNSTDDLECFESTCCCSWVRLVVPKIEQHLYMKFHTHESLSTYCTNNIHCFRVDFQLGVRGCLLVAILSTYSVVWCNSGIASANIPVTLSLITAGHMMENA